MSDKFREFDGLVDLIVKKHVRKSSRELFGEEKAAQYRLDEGGPEVDQSLGIDDLDPAFPDYNVANLFNAYFRDADPEDNTIDYWQIENGGEDITVEQCASAPGGICLVYAPTGAITTSSKLISGAVPIGPGFDMGAVVALGNHTSGSVYIKAQIRWYDESGNLITTTSGMRKKANQRVMRWMTIERPKSAQAASFCSLVLEFSSSGTGYINIFGAGLFPLAPSQNTPGDEKTRNVPPDFEGFWLYDDFDRADASASLGEILGQDVNEAPWAGDTTWLTKEQVDGVADDGMWDTSSDHAVADEDAGSPKTVRAYQIGTTWGPATLDGPEVIGVAEGFASSVHDGINKTTYELNLPDGCDVPGRHLICYVHALPYDDMYAAFVTRAGWRKTIATSGQTVFDKRLGGEDGVDPTGYAAEEATETIEVYDYLGYTPVVAATVILVAGLYDEGSTNPGLWKASTSKTQTTGATTLTPRAITASYTEDVLYMTFLKTESEVIEGPDVPFNDVGSDLVTNDDFGVAVGVRMDYYVGPPETVQPGDYTIAAPGWPATQFLDPGNTNLGLRFGFLGTMAIRGTTYVDPDAAWVVLTERPEGPHNQPHKVMFKFKYINDSNGIDFAYAWQGSTIEGFDESARIDFSLNAGTHTIAVGGETPAALSDPLDSDTWYWCLFKFNDGFQKVKLWKHGEPKPASLLLPVVPTLTGQDAESRLYIEAGFTDLGAIQIDEIWIGYGTETGASGRIYLGIADGASTTYYSPLHWGASGPKVYVDGFLVALDSYDAADWSFVFDRAPSYGAKIEVEVG